VRRWTGCPSVTFSQESRSDMTHLLVKRGLSVQRTRQRVYRAIVTIRLLPFVITVGVGARITARPILSGGLPRNLSFDELRQKGERFLPAKIARLEWDGLRYPFLHDVHLSTKGHLLQGYRRFHFSG